VCTRSRLSIALSLLASLVAAPSMLAAEGFVLHAFERRELTDVYFSEGAGAGDIDGDGDVDIVYGPYWFAGPSFTERHEIWPAKPQPRERYADSFFSWVDDVDGDGDRDVFSVGFPGTPAWVYENPGREGLDRPWTKHQVFDKVSNESPHWIDIAGDAAPELVCTREGYFGYASIDRARPFAPWTFRAISEKIAPAPFGHGLGVGDVNGDGRLDVIHANGWLEQPLEASSAELWRLHEVAFTDSYGGAEMHAYDVDGDGDNDVITSLAAHDFGLAWYEQKRVGDAITFELHRIAGDRPAQSRYGLVFSEPHSVNLADIDGDGLADIVTGKTYWSHHEKSPLWNAGAVVYWFRLVRTAAGVDWVPYRADGDAGIGRQVGVFDVDGDGLPDIVTGGMKGANVLLHRTRAVGEPEWRAAQPKPFEGTDRRADRGAAAQIDDATGRVPGAIEGETLKVLRVGAGKVTTQAMSGFRKGRWSGGEQLFWSGATPRARLELGFEVAADGEYEVSAAFTTARDYAIVNLLLDDTALGLPLDLYDYPDVGTSGELAFGARRLAAGEHRLTVEITGANESAVKAFLVGLDYLRVVPRK